MTEELIYALAKENVSLIELGIPFSYPTAEGPVIRWQARERYCQEQRLIKFLIWWKEYAKIQIYRLYL